MCTQDVFYLFDDTKEVGTNSVQFVDKDHTGNFGVIGIAPVCLGLRLDTPGATKHADTAIEHLERPVNFDRKIHVSRGIDNVQSVASPLAARCG